MIGHYLLTLTPEQEERVLTGVMLPFPDSDTSCLVQTAMGGGVEAARAAKLTSRDGSSITQFIHGRRSERSKPVYFHHTQNTYDRYRDSQPTSVGTAYDNACWRFGTDRINAAIRYRILANIARRELAKQAVPA